METQTRSQSAYSQFITQVKSKEVQRVIIKPERIEYTLKPEFGSHNYYTQPSRQTEELSGLLQSYEVEYTTESDPSTTAESILGWLISAGAIVGTFAFLMKFSKVGGGIGVGRGISQSKARVYNQGKTGITFADVAGVDEAKQELQEVVDFLSNGEKYRKIGAKIPKGVLLVGPP